MARRPKQHDRTIRRGDGYITERTLSTGEARYQARWHDGERWRAKTFRVMEDAEDHLRDIGRKKRRREYVPDAEYTLLDVVDDYLERGASRWKPNTVATYTTIRDTVIDDAIGRQLVTELDPRRMQRWIDGLSRTYSPSRIDVIRALATGALNEAMRLGVIRSNPLTGVRMPKRQHKTHTVWSADESAKALDASRDDPLLHLYYIIAVTTGMRPGEIRALKWVDIDFDRKLLTCRRTMTRDANYSPVVGDTTKTGRARVIALPEMTVEALRDHRRAQTERRLSHHAWHDGDMVLDRGNGAPLPQQTIFRKHRDLIAATGLPACRLHDLRHAAATMLLEAGVDVKVVSDMLGHANSAITRDIYQHVTETMQRTAADTLGDLVGRKHA